MFERILLSVDGSPDSDKAVRTTAELARVHGSQVLVVHGRDVAVLAPPAPSAPVPTRHVEMETEEEGQQLAQSAVAELSNAGIEARGRLLPGLGRIGQQIVETAESENINLIVLGSRGMSRLQEMVLGSVAHRVIHTAQCPVLLVR